MNRFLCIHCHFYQPPRENPWLESVEYQDSAEPYHDWNERINVECYAPNSAARILDGQSRIARIVNNYESISFNFGPTLLSWMEEKAPATYSAILEADLRSRERFSGHGNAIAQVFNHVIMPLSTTRDRYTQVRWGLRDFESRFGREPEGMWLAETAVDVQTLEILADCGIRYTILAPHQAAQVKKRGGTRKVSVEGAKIDPKRAYICRLPSGREINLFFYDGPISRAVAFEGLLSDGERFASRLVGGFADQRRWPQLMNIATDGETYGHHHVHGDMALAYALQVIESRGLAQITNYGEFLAKAPPRHEVEILENTSWSCAHGIERWRSNCGCNTGHAGWNQLWREPLRNALDAIRDELTEPFEQQSRDVLRDPWTARDAYINVVLNRSMISLDKFFAEHCVNIDTPAAKTRALRWMELQRHLMLMYTSCGWFFDELSGVETAQVIMYASRALQLTRELIGRDLEPHFLELLAKAHSNVPGFGNGADIYRRWVKPARLNLLKVGAHYAISSLFDGTDSHSIFCYNVDLHDAHRLASGRARFSAGHATIRSRITLDQRDISFCAVHFGDHNLTAGVRDFLGEAQYRKLVEDCSTAFTHADLPGAVRALDRQFGGVTYSLKSLFKDEQRRVLREILGATLEDTEASYRQIYERNASLLAFLHDIGAQTPTVLRVTSQFVISSDLRHAFEAEELSVPHIELLLESARREQIQLDAPGISFALKRRVARMADELAVYPRRQTLELYRDVVRLARSLPFEVDLWSLQNVYYRLLETLYPEMRASDDENARAWAENFAELGQVLGVVVPEPATQQPEETNIAPAA